MNDDTFTTKYSNQRWKHSQESREKKIKSDDGGFIFSGKAYHKIMMENKDELVTLSNWASTNYTKKFDFEEI